ncbi:MAG TPA: response regulator transcription factor [Bellilinea sp.]|nr:response regulator transcription factor [Bellilinea sp.]
MRFSPRILLIEVKRLDHKSFHAGLTDKHFTVDSVSNGAAGIERMDEHQYHVVIIDAASLRTSGKRICNMVREKSPKTPIILIQDDKTDNISNCADVRLRHPFTLNKLLNRLKPFLPANEESTLRAGPICLDTSTRTVRCGGRQASLTPRLLALLKEMMDKPGQVFHRNDLFTKIWNTDYTGDTRTLDVHISWLRQVLEDNPRKPKYLITVRGLGYRLDI